MKKIRNHLVEFFKAISQTFFFQDARFGAMVLLLFLAFNPYAFGCALIASLIGYAHSVRYSTPKVLRDTGLISINGFFFGIAMASLYQPSPSFFVSLLLGAICIPSLTKAAFEVLQHWKLSPYITPYILAVWLIWLSARGAALELPVAPALLPQSLAQWPSLHPDWDLSLRVVWSIFLGTGRLLFIPDAVFGFSVWLLVMLFSLRRALYFILGTALATTITLLLGSHSVLWEYGLSNYSAGLVGLALASSPERFSWRRILFFCMLSALVTTALEELLRPQQLPVLSLPYVLTLWLAVLSRVPRLSVSWAPRHSAVVAKRPRAEIPLKQVEESREVA